MREEKVAKQVWYTINIKGSGWTREERVLRHVCSEEKAWQTARMNLLSYDEVILLSGEGERIFAGKKLQGR